MSNLIEADLKTEEWREYIFGGTTYRIENPLRLYFSKTGTTHRVVDTQGITHCLPVPGAHGCVLRWKASPPVSF